MSSRGGYMAGERPEGDPPVPPLFRPKSTEPYMALITALNEAKIAAEDLVIQRNAARVRGHDEGYAKGYQDGYTDAMRAHVIEDWHGLAKGTT